MKAVNFVDLLVAQHVGLILLSGKTGAEASALLFARFRGRRLSPSTINICVLAKVLFARWLATGTNSQTPAAQDFKSRAKLLFARSRTRRFWSLVCWRVRFRAVESGCFWRYRFQ